MAIIYDPIIKPDTGDIGTSDSTSQNINGTSSTMAPIDKTIYVWDDSTRVEWEWLKNQRLNTHNDTVLNLATANTQLSIQGLRELFGLFGCTIQQTSQVKRITLSLDEKGVGQLVFREQLYQDTIALRKEDVVFDALGSNKDKVRFTNIDPPSSYHQIKSYYVDNCSISYYDDKNEVRTDSVVTNAYVIDSSKPNNSTEFVTIPTNLTNNIDLVLQFKNGHIETLVTCQADVELDYVEFTSNIKVLSSINYIKFRQSQSNSEKEYIHKTGEQFLSTQGSVSLGDIVHGALINDMYLDNNQPISNEGLRLTDTFTTERKIGKAVDGSSIYETCIYQKLQQGYSITQKIPIIWNKGEQHPLKNEYNFKPEWHFGGVKKQNLQWTKGTDFPVFLFVGDQKPELTYEDNILTINKTSKYTVSDDLKILVFKRIGKVPEILSEKIKSEASTVLGGSAWANLMYRVSEEMQLYQAKGPADYVCYLYWRKVKKTEQLVEDAIVSKIPPLYQFVDSFVSLGSYTSASTLNHGIYLSPHRISVVPLRWNGTWNKEDIGKKYYDTFNHIICFSADMYSTQLKAGENIDSISWNQINENSYDFIDFIDTTSNDNYPKQEINISSDSFMGYSDFNVYIPKNCWPNYNEYWDVLEHKDNKHPNESDYIYGSSNIHSKTHTPTWDDNETIRPEYNSFSGEYRVYWNRGNATLGYKYKKFPTIKGWSEPSVYFVINTRQILDYTPTNGYDNTAMRTHMYSGVRVTFSGNGGTASNQAISWFDLPTHGRPYYFTSEDRFWLSDYSEWKYCISSKDQSEWFFEHYIGAYFEQESSISDTKWWVLLVKK